MRILFPLFFMSCTDGAPAAGQSTPTEPTAGWETTVNTDTDTIVDSGEIKRYHPEGYEIPALHSVDAKLHTETCTDCHGADLKGTDDALSCDTCHTMGWRTDCTFCHGGTDNPTGAPPGDLLDAKTDAAFGAHSRHVEENTHAPFDCATCHVTPEDVLTAGHLFDDTPGLAEVSFTAGLSGEGTWDGSKNTCSNLYCHSNAQDDGGTVAVTDGPLDCASCHPSLDSSREAWESMSGKHVNHLRDNIGCQDCHVETTHDGATIATPDSHVNGVVDVAPEHDTIAYDPKEGTCTGSCHREDHNARRWVRLED